MKKSIFAIFLFSFAQWVSAQQIVSPQLIQGSENAVITDDGRYFVAAAAGLFEVSRDPMSGSGVCAQDVSGLHVCLRLQPTTEDGTPCMLTGLTSDGVDLYGSCSAFVDGDVNQITGASLYRIRPEGNGGLETVVVKDYDVAVWYNGMAMDDDGNLYMSASSAKFPHASIVKVVFTNANNLEFSLSTWKMALGEYMPNGIQIEGSSMYYVGGHNIFKININTDGTAGAYKTYVPNQFFSALG